MHSSKALYLQTIRFMMEICRWKSLIYADYCYFFSSGNIEPFWRYQNFSSRKEDVNVHSPPIYGRIIKWRKTMNQMSGNIPGGIFLGGNFLGGSLMGGNVPDGKLPGGNFPRTVSLKLEKLKTILWQILGNFMRK